MHAKSRLLNTRLSAAITGLRHGELIVVADAGLPIPAGVEALDVALSPGVPSLDQVLLVLRDNLVIYEVLVATEMETVNGPRRDLVAGLFGDKVRVVPHENIEALLSTAKLVIQTGECSPYANVVLVGGVDFFEVGMAD